MMFEINIQEQTWYKSNANLLDSLALSWHSHIKDKDADNITNNLSFLTKYKNIPYKDKQSEYQLNFYTLTFLFAVYESVVNDTEANTYFKQEVTKNESSLLRFVFNAAMSLMKKSGIYGKQEQPVKFTLEFNDWNQNIPNFTPCLFMNNLILKTNFFDSIYINIYPEKLAERDILKILKNKYWTINKEFVDKNSDAGFLCKFRLYLKATGNNFPSISMFNYIKNIFVALYNTLVSYCFNINPSIDYPINNNIAPYSTENINSNLEAEPAVEVFKKNFEQDDLSIDHGL